MRKLLYLVIIIGLCASCLGITPPTVVTVTSSVYNTTTSPKTASPAGGWQTGDIIVVIGVGDGGTVGQKINTPTATGLTFTDVINHAAASNSDLLVSTATAGSTSSGAISATHSATNNFGITVFVIRGSSGLGNSTSQFTATRTVSLTPVQANSTIIWGVGDWAAAAVQSATPTPTATDIATQVGVAYTPYVAHLTNQVSSGAVSYGIGGTGTGPFSIGVLELKGTAGGATCSNSIAMMGVGCR